MDLSKAFDSVLHALLIAKIKAYNVGSNCCKLIASYLQNRYQRVKIQDPRSGWNEISRGFSQGSTLGPLLFNVYFNDIFLLPLHGELFNWADDNLISVSGNEIKTIERTLSLDADQLLQGFTQNYFESQTAKYQAILFKPSSKSDIEMNLEV